MAFGSYPYKLFGRGMLAGRLAPLLGALVLALTVSHAASAGLANVYIAQSPAGGGDGSSCANATPATFFNAAGNWGPGSTQIGAGTTVHLCGTIATTLTVQGSGVNGSAITILFENGAKLSQPVCSPSCLNLNNHTFLTIDGQTNGVIENTANGTGLANQTTSQGINAIGCSNCEIKNLTIQNIYVRTSPADTSIDQTQMNCIKFSGSNVLVHDNICHDMGWALFNLYGNGDSNVRVYNNNVYNIDHGYILAGIGPISVSGFYFYNNHVHDYAKWDSPSNTYHHDGIHAFGVNATGLPVVTEFWIYNNLLDGDIGANVTGHIFLEGSDAGTPWTSTGNARIFNNVVIGNRNANGLVQVLAGNAHEVYNNTIVGGDPLNGIALTIRNSTNVKIKNNLVTGANYLVALGPSITFNNIATDLNYNVYANCQSFNCYTLQGVLNTSTFSLWKSQCGCDAASTTNTSTGLDATGDPLPGSPVLGMGTNLTSVGITVLNSDKAGMARPTSGAWDAGAYNATPPLSAPSGLTVR